MSAVVPPVHLNCYPMLKKQYGYAMPITSSWLRVCHSLAIEVQLQSLNHYFITKRCDVCGQN